LPSDVIKIRVRAGTAEAEVEADVAHIKEAIELIPEVVNKLPEVRGQPSPDTRRALVEQTSSEVEKPRGPEHLPLVNIEKSDSLTDIISKFFGDPWGRDRRKLADVREALESYGLNFPKQSVAVALLRLAKNTKIRRFKAEDGEFVYTASTAMMAPPQAQPTLETEIQPNL
jgi:hypothetical protein